MGYNSINSCQCNFFHIHAIKKSPAAILLHTDQSSGTGFNPPAVGVTPRCVVSVYNVPLFKVKWRNYVLRVTHSNVFKIGHA